MQMTVDCSLPSQSLNPQELVHVLQIVREATLNAIKHSKGTLIEVKAILMPRENMNPCAR